MRPQAALSDWTYDDPGLQAVQGDDAASLGVAPTMDALTTAMGAVSLTATEEHANGTPPSSPAPTALRNEGPSFSTAPLSSPKDPPVGHGDVRGPTAVVSSYIYLVYDGAPSLGYESFNLV